MNQNTLLYKQAVKLGESLVGKSAQSNLLTQLTATGNQALCASQRISAYEIVEVGVEPTVMAIIGGESVFEEYLINIH